MPKLTIDVVGLVLFSMENNVAVMVNATKPRKTDSGGILTPHAPFIAVDLTDHDNENTDRAETFLFDIRADVLGVGRPNSRYAAYVLSINPKTSKNKETLSAGTTGNARVSGSLTNLARVSAVVGRRPFKKGVFSGEFDDSVIARIDLTGATVSTRTPPGTHELTFGSETKTFANVVRVEYELAASNPRILITDGFGSADEILLTGTGPWHAVAGNLPVEELLQIFIDHPGKNEPLHHFEVVYDLYDLGKKDSRPIPVVASHGSLNTSGVCGPPYDQ